jgi:flavin-dependent dehydrogenase
MVNEVDIMIIGSDLSSIIAASLLSRKGFRVALIDEARRIGGNCCYIPLSLAWLRKLGINVNDQKIVKRVVDRLCLSFNLGKTTIHSILNSKIVLLDVVNLCEELVKDSEIVFHLWSRWSITEKTVNGVRVDVKDPSGEFRIVGRLLAQGMPASGELNLKVSTGYCVGTEIKDSLVIDRSGINLYVKHRNLLTGVLTSPNNPISTSISTVEVPWGLMLEPSVGPVLKFGPSAGHAVPPWIGDYLVNSAFMASEVALTYLEEREDESILRKYLNFLSMVNMCKMLHEYSIKGKIEELPVSFVSEALKPPI